MLYDDIIGNVDEPPVRNIGEDLMLRTGEVHSIIGGVSIAWLMKAFRMGRATIEKKIRGCQPIGKGKHGTPLFDLPEVAAYLVSPRVDLEEYLKGVKPDALPERLREAYWSAKLKQQRFEEKAAHLWRTERVLEVVSEILQNMRSKLQLIPEGVERETGLTPEQHQVIRDIVDAVQDEMFKDLVRLGATGSTPNQLGEERAAQRDYDDLI